MGALVLAPKVLSDFMVHRSRPFIYATAPSPLVAALVRGALLVSRFGAERREALGRLVGQAGALLSQRCGIAPSGTQIQPVIVGADERAVALAAAMQARGFDIRAVRPPTVPEGTARLRISLTLNVDEATVAAMTAALAEEMQGLAA
jgi:8-amino-7-oxononanoate synthase